MFHGDTNIGSKNVGKNQPRRGTYAPVHYRGGYRSNRGCVFVSPSVGRSYLRRSDPAEWQMLVLGKALSPERRHVGILGIVRGKGEPRRTWRGGNGTSSGDDHPPSVLTSQLSAPQFLQ
jgi:hypothetical protein